MTNKFYAADASRAERVNDLFAAVAPRYDLINDLQSFGLHRWWKRQLRKLAQPQAGDWVLDLCCGTGDVALAFARRGFETTGLDFSAPMLAIAERRRQASALPVRFLRGDAQEIPFPDASFEVVTVSYGLRNLADWQRGLREMTRVAKPGARIIVLDFGKPANPIWRAFYFGYLRHFVPIMGKLFCGDADTHAYILKSLMHYPAQTGVAKEMQKLGLGQLRTVNLIGGIMSLNYGVKTH